MVDRNALARATESTSSPTPGYLYNDLAKSAATSPAAASEIATYLIRRLESKNNVHIKYKCLKVIQMIASHPATRGQFKRVIIQDTSAVASIKNCLTFRGPPDAVHGDMLYEKVRNQAKETLDAVYSDDPSSEQNHYQHSGGSAGGYGAFGSNSNSQSYGNYNYNSSASSSAHTSSSGPKRMEGIGNPMFPDPRLNQPKELSEMTVSDVISGVKEGFVGMIKDPLARNVPSGPRPGGMGGYGGHSNNWKSPPPGQSQLAHATNGTWTMASNRGPNAYNSESYKAGSGNVSSGVGGSWGGATATTTSSVASQSRHTAHNTSHHSVVNISGSTGGARADGAYEKNLITELCPPGGMKAEPPPDKLQSFAQAIPSLNPDLICPALLDALEDGQPWIIRAKALCVMEVCINVAEESVNGGLSSNNAYADFFHACKDEIEPLSTHPRSAVRDPAKRVLKALGLDIPDTASGGIVSNVKPVTRAPVAAPAPPAANLLDFGEPNDESVEVSVDVAPPPPLPSDAPPAPPVPPASAPINNSQSLFGGMNLKSNTSVVVQSSVSAPKSQSDSNDLLGDISEPVVARPPPNQPTSGLFDDIMVKAPESQSSNVEKENVENSSTTTTAPGPATSGFSFISADVETKKPESSNNAKASFDPLLMSSDSSTPVNKMHQYQIQGGMNANMAAVMQKQQQQIMMMQAQMQQMQMSASNPRFMMMQQNQMQNSSGSAIGNNSMMMPMRQNVMGASNGSGVATSFAFMEDPNKAKREASNKKFDFVLDAMKGAK